MFCDKCGTALEDGAMFCGACGARLWVNDAVQYDMMPAAAEPKTRRPTGYIIAVVVLAAAVIVLAVMLLTGGNNKPTKPDSDKEDIAVNDYLGELIGNSGVSDTVAADDTDYETDDDNYNDVIVDDNYSDDDAVADDQSNHEIQAYQSVRNEFISSVSCSGYLPPSGERIYDGYQTVDGNPDTCWIVNTNEDGAAGAWIEYRFDGTYSVHGIKMINGNVYRDGYYYLNGHIKEFRLDFSDGTSRYFTADEIESRSADSNVFDFGGEMVATSYVRLTIISSYVGSKPDYRTNSAMAEFVVF